MPQAGRANQRRRTRALRNSMSAPWKGVEWNRSGATVAAGQCGTALLARAGRGGPGTVLTAVWGPLARQWGRAATPPTLNGSIPTVPTSATDPP